MALADGSTLAERVGDLSRIEDERRDEVRLLIFVNSEVRRSEWFRNRCVTDKAGPTFVTSAS